MLYTGMGHAITPQGMVVAREPRLPACSGGRWTFVKDKLDGMEQVVVERVIGNGNQREGWYIFRNPE